MNLEKEGSGSEIGAGTLLQEVKNHLAQKPAKEIVIVVLEAESGGVVVFQKADRFPTSIGLLETGKALLVNDWLSKK